MDVREFAKRNYSGSPFLSPQLEASKENRPRANNLVRPRRTLPFNQNLSNNSRSRCLESVTMNANKFRSMSPLLKPLEEKKPNESVPTSQHFYQSKLRSILQKNLVLKETIVKSGSISEAVQRNPLQTLPQQVRRIVSQKQILKTFEVGSKKQPPKTIEKCKTFAEEAQKIEINPKEAQNLLSTPEHSREAVPIVFKTRDAGENTTSLFFEVKGKLALNVFQQIIDSLVKIKNKLSKGEDITSEVHIFLEQSRSTAEIENFFRNPDQPAAQSVLLAAKLSLLLVLFALNFMDIKSQKNLAIVAIDAILEAFIFALTFFKENLSEYTFKCQIDNILATVSPSLECKYFPKESLKALKGALRLARSKLVELSFLLYRSQELCVRLESLALESEKLRIFESHNKAFLLFESVLRGSCQEPANDPDSFDPSFSLDVDDPNFILQPLEVEKYLPPRASSLPPFTLVLDLDETLVHFEESVEGGNKFLIRPHASDFISQMHRHYELVVFTAAIKDYADWILDRIDPNKLISHRLYRYHTRHQNGLYLKDLSRLGRDLSKVIIVDNIPENFQLQPENGIYIKSWYDDPNDNALLQLTKVLMAVSKEATSDVRIVLQEMQMKQLKKIKNNS